MKERGREGKGRDTQREREKKESEKNICFRKEKLKSEKGEAV